MHFFILTMRGERERGREGGREREGEEGEREIIIALITLINQ
jgi:hypothetical protein